MEGCRDAVKEIKKAEWGKKGFLFVCLFVSILLNP